MDYLRVVLLPSWALDEFELIDILKRAKISGFLDVCFTSSSLDGGFSEPISVDDENPKVVYEEAWIELELYAATTDICDKLLPIKEVPHYRDLEYKHKRRR